MYEKAFQDEFNAEGSVEDRDAVMIEMEAELREQDAAIAEAEAEFNELFDAHQRVLREKETLRQKLSRTERTLGDLRSVRERLFHEIIWFDSERPGQS